MIKSVSYLHKLRLRLINLRCSKRDNMYCRKSIDWMQSLICLLSIVTRNIFAITLVIMSVHLAVLFASRTPFIIAIMLRQEFYGLKDLTSRTHQPKNNQQKNVKRVKLIPALRSNNCFPFFTAHFKHLNEFSLEKYVYSSNVSYNFE